MPCTTYTHEEFSLATVEGVDAFRTDVALELTYERDGSWTIDQAGSITGWTRFTNQYGHRIPSLPKIAWFQEPDGLEAIIIARALAKYSAEIDEHVWACLREDHEDERMWGAA